MMKRAIALAKEVPEWFQEMTEDQQETYLKEHPNSKLAKTVHTKPPTKKAVKEKRDPYAEVPEEDRKVMHAAKERGFTVPPKWSQVWLNPDPEADLQVTGVAANGKKQYLYSVKHNTLAAAMKFERIRSFTKERSKMMKKVADDFESVPEAQVAYLISKTGFRNGGDADNHAKVKAYGASSLTSDHVKINGDTLAFDFIGKEGVRQQHTIKDKKLASILADRKGRLFDTNAAKVLKYVKSLSKTGYKVHDFRTYIATATALDEMSKLEPPKTKRDYEKSILEVAKIVSERLGNTPKMARDNYIDPTVFKSWEEGIVMKEQSSDRDEDQAMLDFVENNHYQVNPSLIEKYKEVKAMQHGHKREQAYREFQKVARGMGMVCVHNKQEYLKSLRVLEDALKDK